MGSYAPTLEPTRKASFVAHALTFTPPTSATDIWAMSGSSSKKVKIHKILLSVKGSGTVALTEFFLIKRSSANTAGTFVASTVGKMDSASASSTVNSVGHYTANPSSLGTLDHRILNAHHVGNANSVASNTTLHSANPPFLTLYDALGFGGPITLNGTSELLVINLNGVTISNSGTLSVTVFWTEE